MKYQLTVQGPFEGGDPSTAAHLGITIGRFDLASTADAAAEWTRAAVLRLGRGDADPLAVDDDEPAAVSISDVPIALWEELTDAAS